MIEKREDALAMCASQMRALQIPAEYLKQEDTIWQILNRY
jgi:hypothetical protein